MREEELEDGSGVPMSGVSRRIVTRVERSRVPDVVGMHPLRSRLNRSALVPCPPRLSVVPRATVDGLSVHQVAPHWQRYQQALEDGQEYDLAMDRFRWLLHEYRVSVFAQQLKTAEKVSAKRLEQAWKEVLASS